MGRIKRGVCACLVTGVLLVPNIAACRGPRTVSPSSPPSQKQRPTSSCSMD